MGGRGGAGSRGHGIASQQGYKGTCDTGKKQERSDRDVCHRKDQAVTHPYFRPDPLLPHSPIAFSRAPNVTEHHLDPFNSHSPPLRRTHPCHCPARLRTAPHPLSRPTLRMPFPLPEQLDRERVLSCHACDVQAACQSLVALAFPAMNGNNGRKARQSSACRISRPALQIPGAD